MSSAFDVDNTLGALLIGTLVSYALFGVTTTQAYTYWRRFGEDDSWRMKTFVAAVWHVHRIIRRNIFDSLCLPGAVNLPTQSALQFHSSTTIGSLVSYFIQSFFAYRIYALSKNLWIPCICWTLSLFRVVPPNVVIFACIHEPVHVFIVKWSWLFDAVWAVTAAIDLLIAGTLVFLLHQRRNRSLGGTTIVVDKLILWTIETGVLTSITSITMMAVFLSMRFNFVWMAFFVVIPRLFSNSLFASLNSRAALRRESDHQVTDPKTSPVFEMNSRVISLSVPMSTVTTTSSDG
ncbi:hypothetical protein MVEN_02284500 [Mycena venus]|uniref:DUF6534 domain-containing protein n=1 Tax=Mycena venus TaxID=2733690 RepID=A0A8H6X5T4_9AGAR|nr:hypothetical protein MVEN_02284500 [Mycena venus]